MDTYRQEIIETQKVRSDLLKQKLILNAVLGGVGFGLTRIGAIRGLEATRVLESAAKELESAAKTLNNSTGALNVQTALDIQTALKAATTSSEATTALLNGHIYLVLCLIPLVCVYMDLLCNHQNLKVLLIANFLKDPRRIINKKSPKNSNKQDHNNNTKQNTNNLEPEDYRLYERICEQKRDTLSLEQFALKASSIILSLLLILLPFIIELDTQNRSLDDICLTFSGFLGIVLIIWVDFLYNKKSDLIEFSEQKVDSEATKDNKSAMEYEKYLKRLTEISDNSKMARSLQWVVIGLISAVFVGFTFYIKSVSYYDFANTTLWQITSYLHNINCLLIVISLILIAIYAALLYYFNLMLKGLKDLKDLFESKNSPSLINSFYKFLIAENAITNIKITNIKELPKQVNRNGMKILGCLSIFIIICCVTIFLSSHRLYDISNNLVLLSDVKSSLLEKRGNAVGILGVIIIGLLTLIPDLNSYFSNFVNDIYKLKSFLPKELGQIQEEFIAKIEKEEITNKVERLTLNKKSIEFSKLDPINDEENYTYLLLIKCRKGIAIINPSKYLISSDDAIVNVNNSLNQDNLKTGNYWEIKFDFPITIGTPKSNQNSEIQEYQFGGWKKTTDSITNSEQSGKGIEIGEKIALFFVYID